MILLILNFFLLIMGMLLDATANILLLGPILAPVAVAVGINPLHFAIVMVVNLMIGLITPPVGTCLFGSVPLAKVRVEKIIKAIWPFIIAEVVVLLIITYLPETVLFIPRMLGFIN